MRNKLIILIFSALILAGAGCAKGSTVRLTPVTLQYWRIDDDPAAMQPIIDAYRKIHPNITITYTRLRADEYERKLLEAFAENRGPDLFSIASPELGEWRERVLPLPKETTIPTQTVNAQKQIVTTNKKSATLSLLDVRKNFVEDAANTIVKFDQPDPEKPGENKIFGLPLSFDTLAMFYNKDLLRKANIDKPPATWKDVEDQSKKLTVLDKDNVTIKQSGAALGGAGNVLYSTDILTAIMMQNGADMADESGSPRFNVYSASTTDRPFPPGVEALRFYQGFANANTPTYTWNENMAISLDAFVAGKVAIFFGYPIDMQKIRDRAPKLDFAIAPLPQIDPSRPKNVPNFPIEVVSKKTAHPNEAWDFLQFATSKEQVSDWLTTTKRPTALRALIQQQLTDPDLAPFAGQLLTANSWYDGNDWSKVQKAFNTLILARPTFNHPEFQPLIDQAADAVSATMF